MEDEIRAENTPQAEPPSGGSQTPPPRRQRPIRFNTRPGRGCLIAALIFIGLPFLLLIIAGIIGAVSGAKPKIALIHVEGVITAGRGGGLPLGSREAGSEYLIKQLEQARKDENVKGIILRINSPGGSAAGSQEIYDEILRVRKAKKPVYVSMGDVAASGGYHIAAAANKIYANTATATGSIGVIFETTEFSQLAKRLGIESNVVKSGKFKDMGSPFRPLTPAERQIVQNMINDIFDQFLDAVSTGRNIPKAKVREMATGQVYTGRQAKQLKLVDELGGLQETVAAIGKATGLGSEPKIASYDKSGLSNLFFGSSLRDWSGILNQLPNSRVPSLR